MRGGEGGTGLLHGTHQQMQPQPTCPDLVLAPGGSLKGGISHPWYQSIKVISWEHLPPGQHRGHGACHMGRCKNRALSEGPYPLTACVYPPTCPWGSRRHQAALKIQSHRDSMGSPGLVL